MATTSARPPAEATHAQVYYVAKQCSSRCSPEEYAVALGRHFVDTYPKVGLHLDTCSSLCDQPADLVLRLQVSKAKIRVEAMPWSRVSTFGSPHNHGKCCSQAEQL